MTDVVYNHSLPLKEFPVSYPALKAWLDQNTTNCCGFSVDSEVRIHFTTAPTEEVTIAINDYWDDLIDDGTAAAEVAKARALLIEETKIQYGIKLKAYLGYLCEQASYTPAEYAQILSDPELSLANVLLLNGALETVKYMVDNYTPSTYFTNNMKIAMSAELERYITLVAAI